MLKETLGQLAEARRVQAEIRAEHADAFLRWEDKGTEIEGLTERVRTLVKEYAQTLGAGTHPLTKELGGRIGGQAIVITRPKEVNVELLCELHPSILSVAKASIKISLGELDRLTAAGVVDKKTAERVLGVASPRVSIKNDMEEVDDG